MLTSVGQGTVDRARRRPGVARHFSLGRSRARCCLDRVAAADHAVAAQISTRVAELIECDQAAVPVGLASRHLEWRPWTWARVAVVEEDFLSLLQSGVFTACMLPRPPQRQNSRCPSDTRSRRSCSLSTWLPEPSQTQWPPAHRKRTTSERTGRSRCSWYS